jgi:hypothetical protein
MAADATRREVEDAKMSRGAHKEIQEAVDAAHIGEPLDRRIQRDREIEDRLIAIITEAVRKKRGV